MDHRPAGRRPVRGRRPAARLHRARRGDRHRPCRAGSRPPLLYRDRDRLRACPAPGGARPGRRGAPAGGIPGGRRRGTALRGRILRLRPFGHRGDVHRRPPAVGGRTAAGVPQRRCGGAGELDTGRVRRADAQIGRAACPTAARCQPADQVGAEDGVRELLGAGAAELAFTTASVRQRFPSPEFFADLFLAYYWPTFKPAEALTPEGRSAFRDDLIALAAASNQAADGTLVSDWEFLVTVATKA